MKYFTKEWFDDTILAGMCFQVRKSAKAETFSEKYYLSLYKDQKKWFVKNEKYIAKHNIETVDLGVAVISMHAPYELVSKADVYTAHKAFFAFLKA